MSTITPETNLNALKVTDLKKELKDRGITLPASAKKSDLVAKLTEVLGAGGGDSTMAAVSADTSTDFFEQAIREISGEQMTSPSSVNATLGSSTMSSIPSTPSMTTSPIKSAPVLLPTAPGSPQKPSESTSPTVKKVVPVVSNPVAALQARAARFGGSVSSVAKSVEELDALKKRADRFGVSVSPSVATLEEKARLAQRASRFNIPESEQVKPKKPLGLKRKNFTSSTTESSSLPSSKKILTKEEEEKMKKRKERFGSSL